MSNQPVPNMNEQLSKLYAEKGELVTQLEVANGKLGQINQQLAQLLGLTAVQIPQPNR